MRFVTLDFETYFDSDYTLKKMSTEAYIRDPRFEAHGAAIKWQHNIPARWYAEKELRQVLADEDWSDTFLISHHAQFDHLILSHHYDVHPRMSGCTLALARLLIGNHLSVSLDTVRKYFDMPAKRTPYELFKGRRWHELTPDVQQLLADGCEDETESVWTLFGRFVKSAPPEELEVIDTTIKMFTAPVLRADMDILAKVWEHEDKRKKNRMVHLQTHFKQEHDRNITEDDFQSANLFAELLRLEGVEPDTKVSDKGNTLYQFAQNDDFMRDYLLEHDDALIRDLAETRLGVKSTLLQTRSETLAYMAQRGPMPVYLHYCGAHTKRWSGGDRCNFQNLNATLEEAIQPPEGYWAFAPDASQIECRLLNFVAGQEDKIEDFRLGRDPYVGVAEAFCGHPVNKNDHPQLRQAGKVVELQAGYQSGGAKIKATLRNKAQIIVSLEEAERYKMAYRGTHPHVEQLWKDAARVIARIAGGDPMQWGPVRVESGKLILPNNTALLYPSLEYHVDNEIGDRYWRYKNRKGWTKLYGGKLVENLIQALARVVISQAMVRIARMGYRIINTKHDSMWILIPKDGREQEHLQLCMTEMKREPAWLPNLPLDAEGSLSERYSK